MVNIEHIQLKKHVSLEDIDKRIKSIEKDAKILKRLYFIKFRYQGKTVENAARMVGVTKMVGYQWQKRWNEKGVEGLKPIAQSGRPLMLRMDQIKDLKDILSTRDDWSTKEIRNLIKEKYGIEYSLKEVWWLMRNKFRMKFGKPYVYDYRRPKDAEDILKKTSHNKSK